jgi:hypothetical protein
MPALTNTKTATPDLELAILVIHESLSQIRITRRKIYRRCLRAFFEDLPAGCRDKLQTVRLFVHMVEDSFRMVVMTEYSLPQSI